MDGWRCNGCNPCGLGGCRMIDGASRAESAVGSAAGGGLATGGERTQPSVLMSLTKHVRRRIITVKRNRAIQPGQQ
jgi:hypothetical protein